MQDDDVRPRDPLGVSRGGSQTPASVKRGAEGPGSSGVGGPKEGLWVSERFLQVRLQRLMIIQEARGRRVSAHSPSPKARQPSGQDPHSLIPSGWLLYRAPEEEAPRRPFPARPSALPYHLGPPGSTSTF